MSTHRSHRKVYTQYDQSRQQLKALLTTMKHHCFERPQPIQKSLDIDKHMLEVAKSGVRVSSLPRVQQRKHSVGKTCPLNLFEKHIIGNYLNADLKCSRKKQISPRAKPKKNKRKLKAQRRIIINKTKGVNLVKQQYLEHQKQTIEQADLSTVKNKSKYHSKYRSMPPKDKGKNEKQYSLRDEPMKHYVLQKSQRKKRQWKEKSPLERETYFAAMRNKLQDYENQNRVSVNATNTHQKSNIHLPTEQQLAKFIKSYRPRDIGINIVELIKKVDFIIDLGRQALYFGQYSDGKREGLGIEIREGYLFEGRWMHNLKVKGYEISQGGTYIGSFKEGKKDGKGEFKWNNGQFYSGQWMAGKRHGVGMWCSPKGDSYMGEWKKGVVEGEGVHKTSAGQRYEGSFKNFLKHGWGRQKIPNGDKYQGNYHEGLPHGQGIYVWKDGVTFEGEFVHGLRQGNGVIHDTKGFHFRGGLVHEKVEGSCEINYGDGETYQGQMKDGKRSGKGTLRNIAKRRVFAGFWRDNEFVTEQQSH